MLPLKKDRIKTSAWWSIKEDLISDENVKAIKEVGIDTLLTARISDEKKLDELLTLCDKYELECYVMDTPLYDYSIDRKDELFAKVHRYADGHPSFVGHVFKDEPGTEEYDDLQYRRELYRNEFPGKEPFVNLLPMYANAAQLKYGAGAAAIEYYDADPERYNKYIETYCEKIDTDYIAADIYPVRVSNGVQVCYGNYLENLSIVSYYCRKYNRELLVMMQSMGWGFDDKNLNGAKHVDETDMRFQMFCFMAFGVKHFSHFCYATPGDDVDYGMVNNAGLRQHTYYAAQRIHRELRNIEDVYLSYRNLGAFSINQSDELPYTKFTEQYKEFKAAEIICDEPVLVGCFDKADGEGNAFVLVNLTDIKDRKTITVKVKSDKVLTAYPGGLPIVCGRKGEYYEFVLPCGEGLFITAE